MSKGIQLEDALLMVGPGWADILCRVYAKLPKTTTVTTVKEKYGSLRIYIENGSDRTFDLIQMAEEESETTCELCGKPGEIDVKCGWYKCRCVECKDK
jgi:hypothetical protein